MSAFSVIPKETNRHIAVRSWPGNESDIEDIFGDRVCKVTSNFYDYALVSVGGYMHDPICRGDWLVLAPNNIIEHLTSEEFTAKFSILESIFDLPDPTGKQEQE